MNCIFCKIINKEINSLILHEDEKIIIIMDAFPEVDGHILIIPKNHYETFKDIPDDLLIHINEFSKKYCDILMEKLCKESITTMVNYGKRQEVKHYHMHLLPNYGKKAKHTSEEIYNILKDVK